jgi:hypothetical protein
MLCLQGCGDLLKVFKHGVSWSHVCEEKDLWKMAWRKMRLGRKTLEAVAGVQMRNVHLVRKLLREQRKGL